MSAQGPKLPEQFQGDFENFLSDLKNGTDSAMTAHKEFNPFLQVDKLDEKNEDQQKVRVSFSSGLADKWNYQSTMTVQEFEDWKMRARKEAGFNIN